MVIDIASRIAPAEGPGVVARPVRELVARAQRELAIARGASDPDQAFVAGHMAALKFAAAALVVAPAATRRGLSKSVWVQIINRAPELAGLVSRFEESARVRAGIETGVVVGIPAQAAADLADDAARFAVAVLDYIDAQGTPGPSERRQAS
ncbi:SAV_6107 family HEPN domain-containing protein [Rarobacter incanus]|uniref:SAV-6107-like HEPN domain-containing protein n=1 Tax=Rarobacter incanus TaxID=153494 RepID=A0A542SLH0_9MICO|nr:SAV_6107 family HEPN domain-containing protein [Rarobacter incanus]TQK75484.1 hypothetical protein FB389_0111 [Rarobacter incanus]